MQALPSLTHDVVLIGGGHAHALVLRMLGMAPVAGARLTLVHPGPSAPYSGMLPGHVAGHYPREALDIDLVRLARFAGARLVAGLADGIDTDRREVHVPGRPPIGFDILSIDVGITSIMPAIPGFAANAVPAKPLDRFADAWAAFRAGAMRGARVAMIGGGVAGVELAMAMAHALAGDGKAPQVTVIEPGAPVKGLGRGARRAILQHMGRLGVRVCAAQVEAVEPGMLVLSDDSRLEADFIVGAAGAQPHGWLSQTGLPLTEGYVDVGPTLEVVGHSGIFAAGDCANYTHAPRPKAGVYAVRAAPVLLDNIRARVEGKPLRRWTPQRDYLKLVSLGAKAAVADKFGMRLDGAWLWRLKDRIDRDFMAKFSDLPRMGPEGEPPLCAGCGAKVGPDVLRAALARLPRSSRSDVLSEPGDDAAVLECGAYRQVLTTDHLRAFTEDPWLLGRIAAVHAMGDVWAMGADAQAALATLILPRAVPAIQARMLDEIMSAAEQIFSGEGAVIAGGHTTMGAEVTVGFTVTGLCTHPVTLSGARPGDVLVLTKPVGTGTVLAGEMAGQARGADVLAVLERMAEPQGAIARLLRGAHAMTDVTGFGLAGHLLAILEASGVAAEIDLDAIPLHAGALALAEAGLRSTLFPQNFAACSGRVELPQGARADLLFDPQTAGGLLAAVDRETAEAAIMAGAVEIGRITGAAPRLYVR